ncbi:hypothetical protein HRbin02_01697 [Candidatus Calditenuaceae archaeon HR02]|nr:hypothetical protein HRbin02_01697 [Candidatus Calditenuaceae archaeon HR02]
MERAVDVLDELRRLVDGWGEVVEEYGGYAIKIVNGARLPWSKICELLLGINHEIWVERRGHDMYIVSKPATD